MKNKIFDIIPPSKRIAHVPDFSARKKPSNAKRLFLIFSAVFLVIFIGCCFFIKPGAQIEIWPENELIKINANLTAMSAIEEISFSQEVIPALPIKAKKTVSQEFSASGQKKKSVKAQGIIRVYNEYHLPVSLVAGTHFVSDSGKSFHTSKKITISAKREIDVRIEADASGESYNIGPSTFSVPGLREKYPHLFYKVSGKSFSAMAGGCQSFVAQVTEQDLEQAKEILTEKALQESKIALEQQTTGFCILEEAISQDVLQVFSLAKAGQEAESFIFQVDAETSALAFRETDIREFAQEYALSQISEGKELEEESLQIIYSIQNINLEKGSIFLNVDITARVYSEIAQQPLKTAIRGQSREQALQIIGSQAKILKAKVELWPFWSRRLPQDAERIEIKLVLD